MASNSEKKNPFASIIAGLGLLVIGTIVLWLNEGEYVANTKAVKDVSEHVIEVSSEKSDSSNDGKLVCLNGDFIVIDEKVEDDELSIGTKTAKLSRVVEMYQWEEDEHTHKNNKTYSYEKKWSSELIISGGFHDSGYDNPTSKPIDNKDYCASSVSVGAFNLSEKQIRSLETNSKLTIDASQELPDGYKIHDGYITNSENPESPAVGDIRIYYEYNNYKEATVLAVQQGNSFTDFNSENGKTINRVYEGKLNSEEVVKKMTDENNGLKWALRLIGTICIILGYVSLLSPISKLASFVPILGGIVSSALAIIAALVGLIHSLIVIAIAWLFYRPIMSIILIAIVVALVIVLKGFIKNKKEQTV